MEDILPFFNILTSYVFIYVVDILFFSAAIFAYLKKGDAAPWKKFFILYAGWVVAYTTFLSVVQYVVWSSTEFTRLFLPPTTPIAYFFTYIGGRLWLEVGLAILCALFIRGFFAVAARRTTSLGRGDAPLAGFLGLLTGWPGVLVFVPLALFTEALIRVTEHMLRICIKEKSAISSRIFTTGLTLALFIAAAITLILGDFLVSFLGLSVLRV